MWSPGSKSRVCSVHFQDSRFEYPTINLGYDAENKILHLLPPSYCSKRKLPIKSIDFDVGKCRESESKEERALEKSNIARQTEEFTSINNEPVENNLYMKNDAFTQIELDKRDDLLIKKNEELVAKQIILQGENRTLREFVLKNQEKNILQGTTDIKQECFVLYRLK